MTLTRPFIATPSTNGAQPDAQEWQADAPTTQAT